MAKGKKDSSDSTSTDADWRYTLNDMQRDHARRGETPLKPVVLPSGETYQPVVDTGAPVNTDPDTLPPVPRMKKGGKIKKTKPRGVGIALRGHTRAK